MKHTRKQKLLKRQGIENHEKNTRFLKNINITVQKCGQVITIDMKKIDTDRLTRDESKTIKKDENCMRTKRRCWMCH